MNNKKKTYTAHVCDQNDKWNTIKIDKKLIDEKLNLLDTLTKQIFKNEDYNKVNFTLTSHHQMLPLCLGEPTVHVAPFHFISKNEEELVNYFVEILVDYHFQRADVYGQFETLYDEHEFDKKYDEHHAEICIDFKRRCKLN